MEHILLPRLVIAVLNRFSVLVVENSIVSEIVSRCSMATLQARSKPSAILIGWMPRSRRVSLCSSRAPARTSLS